MTPKDLKNSILQLAIQGKLVEQRAEEGTAEELYQQIQKEKAALIKAGKIKKQKPLPEIKEEEKPFDIPETWKWVRFGNVVNYCMGKTPPRAESQWWSSEFPWVSIADMPENGHITHSKECVSNLAIREKFNDRISKAGTLLMSFKLTVGRVSILDIDAVHNEAIISIFPFVDNNSIFQKYLFYILPLITQKGETKDAIKGKTLNSNSINNLLFPLPPLAEQQRIVAKIEELLPLVERYEAAYNRLETLNKRFPEDLKKSILQLAIQGKLVEQRAEEIPVCLKRIKQKQTEEWAYELPKTWKLGHIESISDTVPSKQYQILASQVHKEGKYPVISQSKEYSIGYSDDVSKLYRHEDPIVIFGDHTTEVKLVTFDFIVGADGVKIFAPKDNIIIAKFLYYVLQFITFGLNQIGGYSRHYKYIKDKAIPLPPLAEQQRIVAKIEELLPLCERLK